MSKKKEYWKKRFTSIQDREQLQAEKYRDRLEKKYKKVIADIDRDIQAFYARYAKAEGIDFSTARRDLSRVEKEKWEVSLSEYRKMALSGDFENELESMYARSRISRLEAIQTQIRAHIEVLHKGINEDTGKILSNTFTDTYYRSIYEIQKGTGIGINFATYNQDAVNLLISQPFKGGNYSTRIWNSSTSDRAKLVSELQDTITSAFIRGDSAAKTIGEMTKRLNTSAYNIARVVQTETAYIAGQASAMGYESQGIERYEFLVSLDEITCHKCRPLDGKDFGLDEKIEFVNYPPIHPWCRCTTIPYFKDYDYGDIDTRIARAPDGTVYKVPDMPYEKWHDKYVSTQEDNLAETDKYFQKSVLNSTESGIIKTDLQFFTKIPEEKFTKYALNPLKDANKAKAFKEALGYDLSNHIELIAEIDKHFDVNKLVAKGSKGYGETFEQVMKIKGINGKEANVCTGWILRDGEEEHSLTSAYVTKKKVK